MELPEQELAGKIIAGAFKHGLKIQCQAPITVRYAEQPAGAYVADLVVEGRIICELKAVNSLMPEHEAQLVNYLAATGFDTGLLLNFGKSVSVRRKFRQYRKSGGTEAIDE
jgi:GxxExxY protein